MEAAQKNNQSMTSRSWIPGYVGFYEIDESGRIFSIERIVCGGRSGRQYVPACERKLSHHGTGYLTVRLAKNGSVKTHRVHRLVAITFIPNPDQLPEVNHKDGNKHNNKKSNLEWVTSLENSEHASMNGLMPFGLRNGSHKITDGDVAEILLKNQNGERLGDLLASAGVTRSAFRKRAVSLLGVDEWKRGESLRRSIGKSSTSTIDPL